MLTTRAPASAATLGRAVDRAVVDDEDLVDQARALHQLALDEIDDRADRVLLVAGGRQNEIVVSCFAATRREQVEIAEVEGAYHGGWHGAMVPCRPCFPQGARLPWNVTPFRRLTPLCTQPAPSAPLLRSRPRSTAHSADARPPQSGSPRRSSPRARPGRACASRSQACSSLRPRRSTWRQSLMVAVLAGGGRWRHTVPRPRSTASTASTRASLDVTVAPISSSRHPGRVVHRAAVLDGAT